MVSNLELEMNGKDKIFVNVKDGIKFEGTVTSVQKTSQEFVIRGKLIQEVKNETKG